MDRVNKNIGILCLCLLVMFVVGCDQIKAISEYFNKTNKEVEVSQDVVIPQELKAATPAIIEANVLAAVGSWSITVEEFKERLAALKAAMPEFNIDSVEDKKAVLNEIINQQLLVLDAEQKDIDEEKDVLAAVDEFKKTILVRELIMRKTQEIAVTDEEIAAFYDERKDVLITSIELRVREIVVGSQEAANEILADILKGADFVKAATEKSIAQSAANGGDLGFIKEAPFAEMVNPLLALEKGGVSSVFKGPEGFYIARLEDKKGGEQIPFEEIKADISQNLTAVKQQQMILDYINQLRAQIDININESLLE
ncbi:MAG: peptidyl-prolyl cis-trans isomerase [Candidatus Zapsychrus exili]|nr:peptidyl-prolyl cis-trans isomerase [Candidatus Zapsychrus exili]